MRLTPDQIQAIKQTAETVLGDDARVILFGSRVDDTKKGGDLNLVQAYYAKSFYYEIIL
jgi:pyruvate/2-oxoglutarate/acetoin dehydrogenase E1 component